MAKPLRLSKFELIGFSRAFALPGETLPVQTRGLGTSDDEDFHVWIKGFNEAITAQLTADGLTRNLAQASRFALVVNPDHSADLYVDDFSLTMETLVKRDVSQNEPVFASDIGDIRKVSLPELALTPEHRLIVCIRHGWKFALLFDLNRGEPLDINWVQEALAFVMRRLLFEKLYRSIEDNVGFQKLAQRGWFPFNELIGGEFERLQVSHLNDFDIESSERRIIASFTPERIERLTGRWWKREEFERRKELLWEGVSLFAEGKFIACIKTLITEIEGIIRDCRRVDTVSSASFRDMLKATIDQTVERVGDASSLYFPIHFLRYLEASFYARFDPAVGTIEAWRHSASHGAAPPDAYTATRALQTILVLDQIYRYLTLPEERP